MDPDVVGYGDVGVGVDVECNNSDASKQNAAQE